MAKAGTIEVDLVAKTAKFIEEMKKSSSATEAFGKKTLAAVSGISGAFKLAAVAAAGYLAALGASKFVASLNAASEAVDTLGKKSKNLGIGVGPLSALKFAAEEAGVDFETLSKMAGKAQKSLAEFAATGVSTSDKGLQAFVASLQSGDGTFQSIEKILPRIADHLLAVGNTGERLRLADKIFGRAGGEAFIQLLEDSGGSFDALREKMRLASDLGVRFTDDQVAKLTEYNDAVSRIGAAWLGVRVKVMTEVAPALASIANDFALWVARMGDIVGGIVNRIGAALGDGPKAAAAKEQLKQFGLDLADVLVASLASGAEIAIAAVRDTFVAGWKIIAEDAGEWGKAIAMRLVNPLRLVNPYVRPAITKAIGIINPTAGMLMQDGPGIPEAPKPSFFQRMGQAEFPTTTEAMTRSVYSVSTAVDRLGQSLDAIKLGDTFRDATAAAKEFSAALGTQGKGPTEKGWWSQFKDGAVQGFDELKKEAENFAGLGKTIITDFTKGMSSGLADAALEWNGQWKDMGKAAMDVLNNVLKRITSVALEFAIMRGIVGIGVGLGFGAAATATPGFVDHAPPTIAGAPNINAPVFADGGVPPVGSPFWVGEEGPELMTVGSPAHVYSNPESMALLGRAGGGVTVQIIDQRTGGGPRPQVTQHQGPNGEQQIRVLITDTVKAAMDSGSLDPAMRRNYGVGRSATSR